MAFEATTMIELLLYITWACLAVPVYKHPLFLQVLPNQSMLSEIISTVPFSFCPDLFRVLNKVRPPTIDFFKNLPSDIVAKWGVYVLVLEKKDAVPLIYIGSGTNASSGLRGRFYQYEKKENLAVYVKKAVDEGYDIVHKGLLVWCPIPSATNVPKFRILFYAIEAAFSFMFWSMHSRTKDYGMSGCCPWDRALFSYGDLCSHSALTDGVIHGRFDLSDEQLAAMAATTKEQKTKNHNSSEANIKASKKYCCELCDVPCTSNYVLLRHKTSRSHLEKVAKQLRNSPVKKKSASALSQAKALSLKKYYCRTCDVSCPSKWELNRHNTQSKRHQKMVDEAEAKSDAKSAVGPSLGSA
jgi:cytochrome c553